MNAVLIESTHTYSKWQIEQMVVEYHKIEPLPDSPNFQNKPFVVGTVTNPAIFEYLDSIAFRKLLNEV